MNAGLNNSIINHEYDPKIVDIRPAHFFSLATATSDLCWNQSQKGTTSLRITSTCFYFHIRLPKYFSSSVHPYIQQPWSYSQFSPSSPQPQPRSSIPTQKQTAPTPPAKLAASTIVGPPVSETTTSCQPRCCIISTRCSFSKTPIAKRGSIFLLLRRSASIFRFGLCAPRFCVRLGEGWLWAGQVEY